MGLLDDAIRDHLELKRRRGADPGEVAREQQEALESAPEEPNPLWIEDLPADQEGVVPAAEGHATPVSAASAENSDTALAPEQGEELSQVAQETAELDMRTVMSEHESPPSQNPPERENGGDALGERGSAGDADDGGELRRPADHMR
jgi:hypothetical protein